MNSGMNPDAIQSNLTGFFGADADIGYRPL